MKYEKLKEFDLNSIKSKESADNWKNEVMSSDKNDILKYVNFLRWQQFNGSVNIAYIQRIVNFLSYDELIDFERENSTLLTGDTEDLVLLTIEKEKVIENPVFIDGVPYSVKAVLEDNFESIIIVSDGEKLYKFGFIVTTDLKGANFYAYELFEETQDYYQEIIDAEINTKVNLYCDIIGENQVVKTFKKVDLIIEQIQFILTKKTNKGIMTPVTSSGTYTIIKKENLLSTEGISEDRLQNQLNKYQKEIANSLGIKMNDIHNATDKAMSEDVFTEEKDEFPVEMFQDDFKFSEKYYFSFSTPDPNSIYFTGANYSTGANPLTETILYFHGTNPIDNLKDPTLSDQWIGEVYQLLYKKLGISEEMEGIWNIPNTKLESLMRTLVRAGGDVTINPNGANSFLNRFLRDQKLERIMKTSQNFQIVKKIKTKKDIQEFAKDAGTELYVQLNQPLTAILEGTQRIFGDNHIVFDSDYKLVICTYDGVLDYESASNYAIDNGYKNFYVVEKDKYTSYDAWYKERMKFDEDGNHIIEVEDVKVDETVDEQVLYESETPKDIVIIGNSEGEYSGFDITDDYSSYNITINDNLVEEAECDGFVTFGSVKNFIKIIEEFDIDDIGDCGTDFFLLKNFVGKIKLKVKSKGKFISTNSLGGYILNDNNLCDNDEDIDIFMDIDGCKPIKIDSEVYDNLKLNYDREKN